MTTRAQCCPPLESHGPGKWVVTAGVVESLTSLEYPGQDLYQEGN